MNEISDNARVGSQGLNPHVPIHIGHFESNDVHVIGFPDLDRGISRAISSYLGAPRSIRNEANALGGGSAVIKRNGFVVHAREYVHAIASRHYFAGMTNRAPRASSGTAVRIISGHRKII